MAFLITEAYRLLRTIWTNPNDLAEELSTMLAADTPVVSTSPIQLQGPAGATMTLHPPVTPNDPAITFNFGSGSDSPPITFTPIDLPAGGGGGGGTAVVTGGGGIPAQVVSGSGSNYLIDLYSAGPAGRATARVNAIQLQIDPTEKIPAGTWTIATKVGAAYFICVPVFL